MLHFNFPLFTNYSNGVCHGLVCWTDWHLDEDNHISFGASNQVSYISDWYPYALQRIYFLNKYRSVSSGDTVNCDAILCKNGHLLISFCNTYEF